MENTFYSKEDLLSRLKHCSRSPDKNVIFLVGSALVAPSEKSPHGVPNVDGVIELIKKEFENDPSELASFLLTQNKSNKYQEAFKYLLGTRGPEVANSIIRRAVWEALNLEKLKKEFPGISPVEATNEHCSKLEKSSEYWSIPIAADALGKIVSNCPCFGKAVLTMNFDPLIELSIKKNGGKHYRTVLDQDGNLRQTQSEGCHIVHLHGYWYEFDTLHTSQQLLQPRRQLKSSLSSLISKSTVVLLGYGGWDDIFTNTLIEIVSDGIARPEIIWAFYDDGKCVEKKYSKLLTSLQSGINSGRITLFQNIDCNLLLPKLAEEIGKSEKTVKSNTAHQKVVVSQSPMQAIIKRPQMAETDNPPVCDAWVGRNKELSLIRNTTSPVTFITGIGGQGKSALASQYLEGEIIRTPDIFWDWRDCKEEGDRLQTQVTLLLERISGGRINSSMLGDKDFKEVIELLFGFLKDKECVLIFDNIDHYLDLEMLRPIGGMAALVSAAITKNHKSKFVFTCRPNVRYENDAVLEINLFEGLTFADTKELFRKKGAGAASDSDVNDAHSLTLGHPLWLSLLAVQVARRGIQLSALVSQIKKGAGDLPDNTLKSIWTTVGERQSFILRTMAEMVKPETEERLFDFLKADFNGNKFSKALKSLKELNLIVVKSKGGSEVLLDLHPLIRTFIRSQYRREDQKQYATIILTFFNGMILRFKGALNKNPSYSILEFWTQKIELSTNCGNYEEAIVTLNEIMKPLLARGLPEEFVRLTRKLLAEVNWSECGTLNKEFDDVFAKFIKTLSELGGIGDVDNYLEKYKDSIPGKGAQYINYCDLKCYSLWFRRDFSQAIYWGNEGENLKNNTNVDTRFDCQHNLALAQRDNGDIGNALKYFLKGKTLDNVVNGQVEEDVGGEFYGNIGRCLFLENKHKEALACYKKSAFILNKDDDAYSIMNKGYARFWIGEALEENEQWELAFAFYVTAAEIWRRVAPLKAQEVENTMNALPPRFIARKAFYEYEEVCKQWIAS